MTGMDRIKDKILEDARLKAGAILEQAEQEVRNIMDQASEAEQKRAELLKRQTPTVSRHTGACWQ